MKNRILISGLILVILLVIGSKIVEKSHQMYPDDFNFTYKYGTNGREFLDTYSNTLKYASKNGMVEVKFELSVEEKNAIYSKMRELEFMSIPSHFPNLITFEITPITISELSAEYHNQKNTVRWNTRNFNLVNYENPTEGNQQLKAINELGTFIKQIIYDRLKNSEKLN